MVVLFSDNILLKKYNKYVKIISFQSVGILHTFTNAKVLNSAVEIKQLSSIIANTPSNGRLV